MVKKSLNKNGKINILPTITTTIGADWQERLREANELGIEEIALFPTALNEEKRKILYGMLEKSVIKSIPFAHLRNDMELKELDYFVENYKTKIFCTHTGREFPFIYDHSKYSALIFIENVYLPFNEKELRKFGGICLDISHLENNRRLHKEIFSQDKEILEKYPIGCNHISAITESAYIDEIGKLRYSPHLLKHLSEMDYLKRYPLSYFSSYIAIELENSLKEQLEVRSYVRELIGNKK